MKADFLLPSPIELVDGIDFGFNLYVKRDDLIHPTISGNKYRKLKYNIQHFHANKYKGIISFGGAYSNHIHALASVCKIENIPSVGIIRGEYEETNPTLNFTKECGMELSFVSREEYRLKEKSEVIKTIIDSYANYFLISEGGSNTLALDGVEEIVSEIYETKNHFDYIAVSAGTAFTASGILRGIIKYNLTTKLIVFSTLKGDFLKEVIKENTNSDNFIFTDEYCFGGYAKTNEELMNFISKFESNTSIPLDYVYNGKLLFGLKDMAGKSFFKTTDKVLWIHTGGLQGNIKRGSSKGNS